jgi:hypothetical protein
VPGLQPCAPVPAAAEMAADGRIPVGRAAGGAVPEIGVVEEDVAPLALQGDLTGHPLEGGGQAVHASEVTPGHDPQEPVGR